MRLKTKFLKRLLTTTSLAVILTVNINHSLAGAQDSLSAPTNSPNSFNIANDWLVVGFPGGATPTNDPGSMVFLGQAQNINLDNVIGDIGTLNLYGFTGQTFNITASNSIEGIISDVTGPMVARVTTANKGVALAEGGAGAAAKIALNINIVNDTLELLTNNLGAMGNTTLVSVNTNLKFSADNSVINGTIDGGSNGNGKIEINALNTQFNGVIGGNVKINAFYINDNKSAVLTEDAFLHAGGLTIADNSLLTFTAGKTIDASNNNASINFGSPTSTLLINGNVDTTLLGPFNSYVVSGGIIKANGLTAGKTLTLVGRIGNNNNPLALIEAKGGGAILLTGKQGDNDYVTTIDVRGGNGTVTLNGNEHSFTLLHDNGQGTLIISNDNTVSGQAGYTQLNNGASLSTNSSNPLNKILFQDAGVGTFVNVLGIIYPTNIYANSIETNITGKGTFVFFNGTNIIDAPIGTANLALYSLAAAGDGTIVTLLQPSYFSGGIGFYNNSTIQVAADISVGGVSGIKTFNTYPVTPSTNGTLEFINKAPITVTGQIGDFTPQIGVNGPPMPIKAIKISGADVSVTGKLSTAGIDFAAPGPSTLTIGGPATIGVDGATTANNGNGKIIFDSDATISSLGSVTNKLDQVTFSGDPAKTTTLQGDVYVNDIIADKSNITIADNLKIQANVTGNSTVINLGSNTVTYSGKSKFTGTITFNTIIDGNNNTHPVGKIIVDGNNSVVDFSTTTATIHLTALNTIIPPAGKNLRYSLFNTINNGAVLYPNNITFTYGDANHFAIWQYDPTTFTFSLVIDNSAISNNIQDAGGSSHDVSVATVLVSNPEFGFLATLNPAQVLEVVQRLQPVENTIEVEGTNVENVEAAVNDRIFNISVPFHPFVGNVAEGAGVAAGDEELFKHGIWLTPFYSAATQKKYSTHSGYRTRSGGATLGYDTMLNDDLMLGAAFSYISTDIKSRDQKAGDGAKADTMMLSIYGLQEFKQNWFIQGIASFGSSSVKNHEQRIVANQTLIASSKYDSMVWSMQAVAGKYFNPTQSITLTPMAGLRYERFNNASYHETGASFENLWIKRKDSATLELIVGGRATMEGEFNKVTLIPQIHAFANLDLIGKPARMEIRLEGLSSPIPDQAERPTRRWYNLGAGLTAKYGKMEFGVIYEAQLDKKYIGHQGILKVRVNF